MTLLDISMSPRRTWLWAPDVDSSGRVRKVLATAGCTWRPGKPGGLSSQLVTDIDIGVVALESLEALQAAGISFTWADQQETENRSEHPYGIRVGF